MEQGSIFNLLPPHIPHPQPEPFLLFLGHSASNMALIADADPRILSLFMKANLFIGVMFPKDAFPSINMFSWPLNSMGWHFGDHSQEQQIV